MLNYDVEPSLLRRFVPPGTVLDSFKGRTYISLVGFRFCHTKLLGCFPVPFVLVGPRLSVDLPYGYS